MGVGAPILHAKGSVRVSAHIEEPCQDHGLAGSPESLIQMLTRTVSDSSAQSLA